MINNFGFHEINDYIVQTFLTDKNQESGAPGKIISTESPVEHRLTQGW